MSERYDKPFGSKRDVVIVRDSGAFKKRELRDADGGRSKTMSESTFRKAAKRGSETLRRLADKKA